MKSLSFSSIFICLIFSCGPREKVSKEVFEEVNKNMEVKRLLEVDILDEAMIWGDSISIEAQNNLIANLQKAIEDGGLENAISYCNVNASKIVEEGLNNPEINIRRVSTKNRNPSNKPDEDEAPILDAYAYNVENNLQTDPSIQKIEDGEVYLYTKAIIFPGGICQNCHGDPTSEVSLGVQEVLKEKYPADRALGFKKGDLRGMWSIRIPKKEVVKRL